jgi:hypothetical protein
MLAYARRRSSTRSPDEKVSALEIIWPFAFLACIAMLGSGGAHRYLIAFRQDSSVRGQSRRTSPALQSDQAALWCRHISVKELWPACGSSAGLFFARAKIDGCENARHQFPIFFLQPDTLCPREERAAGVAPGVEVLETASAESDCGLDGCVCVGNGCARAHAHVGPSASRRGRNLRPPFDLV